MRYSLVTVVLALVFSLAIVLTAQGVGYQTPPASLAKLLSAEPAPRVEFDDKAEWALLLQPGGHPSVEALAQPMLSVGGLNVNPANFAAVHAEFVSEMKLKHLATGREHGIVGLPAGLRASHVAWSPSAKKIAFVHIHNEAVDLYVVDVAGRKAVRRNETPLNAVFNKPYEWVDDDTLIYSAIAATPAAAPARPPMPAGPQIKEHVGIAAPVRDSQDLIKTVHEEALFEFYATSQLMRNRRGAESKIGKPGLYAQFSLSPDRQYILARILRKPFPRTVAHYAMPAEAVILDVDGRRQHAVAQLRTEEALSTGFSFDWRNDEPATLYWYGPGTSKEGTIVYSLRAPFNGQPLELFRTEGRLRRPILWGNGKVAWVSEDFRGKGLTRTSRFDPSTGRLEILFEAPLFQRGVPLTVQNGFGREVLPLVDDGAKILVREPSSRSVATFDLATKQREIILSGEHVEKVLDADRLVLLTSRSSGDAARSFFVRSLSSDESPRLLLQLEDPSPRVPATVQTLRYTRSDGLPLSGVLYLPKGYDPQRSGPLPVFMWSYPRRFDSAEEVVQFDGSADAREELLPLSHWELPFAWVMQGYAVFEPHMPIVPTEGHQNGNDTLTGQLCMNAQAAIDTLAAMGVGDRNRVAVGGHSYGAFMTANLLAHCGSLFKAGIAMSGSYNQTITPLGFQDETRTYWQAPQLYHDVSPFSHAQDIKKPLLLIHGASDQHPGTSPLHSELLFTAVQANGGIVRYVSLPCEDHGYRARESLLHLYWEMNRWLEKHVK